MSSIFDKLKTYGDYEQERQAFEARKAAIAQEAELRNAKIQALREGKAGNVPAPIQLANEYQRRMDAGDVQGANLLSQFAKTLDRGMGVTDQGTYESLPGYANALAGIARQKSGAEELGKQQVLSAMEPARKEDIATRESKVNLEYAPQIEQAKKIGAMIGEAEGERQKKVVNAPNIIMLANEAKNILPKATSGGARRMGRDISAYFGKSTESGEIDRKLSVIAAGLASNVPRMEGPQSDKDTLMYKEAAADVANPSIPVEQRIAAVNTVIELQQKYAGINNFYGRENAQISSPKDKGDIPMDAVRELRNNPQTAAQFDEIFGAGAAKMVLGK